MPMQGQRDSVIANPSVCPFISPSHFGIVSDECTYCQTLSIIWEGHDSIFSATDYTKFQQELPHFGR